VDIRKIGLWMLGAGGAALAVGMITDAVRNNDDPTLAQREGVFDLSSFSHALFFGGMCVTALGVLALLFGQRLYQAPGRVTVQRRLAQVGAPLAAIALIAGCAAAAADSSLGEPSEDAATEATETDANATPAAADDGHGHSHGETTGTTAAGERTAIDAATGGDDAHDNGHGTVIPGTATGKSPCEIASPTPASPGQVGAGEGGSEGEEAGEHGERGMVEQVPLTADERAQLEEQMRQARTVVDRFPTVAAAEADRYKKSTVYVPCIGAHYTDGLRALKFDPAEPSELLFDGDDPDSKLVGLSYLVINPGGPPEGFAGENDHWHQHNANGGLCMGPGGLVIGGEDTSEADCKARGGQKRILKDIYMMHAWVVPGFECSWGVFAGECPELGGRIGGTAWDEPAPSEQ
jgi:hypothetical protein